MPEPEPEVENVGIFKVIVEANGTIHADRTPKPDVDIGSGIVKHDDFLEHTIKIFIDMLRNNRLIRPDEYRFLGTALYLVLFDNAIGDALREAIYTVPVRYWKVELQFKPGQEVLASWPWEYLYCPPSGMGGAFFLAQSANLVLTRSLSLALKARDLLVDKLPIKVLFVAASPWKLATGSENGANTLTPVEHEAILEDLQGIEQQHPQHIKLFSLTDPYKKPQGEYKPRATFSSFINAVATFRPNVIHFVGHGRCRDDEEGQLAFMNMDSGEPDWVPASKLASTLMGGDLRLVFLQACESAFPMNPYNFYFSGPSLPFRHNPYEAISSVAMQLARQNIPAVVAMQYRIQSQVANFFARAFYRALIESKSVDTAMQEARLEILSQISDWSRESSFGLPMLYLRQSGPLFPLLSSVQQTTAPAVGSPYADYTRTTPPVQPIPVLTTQASEIQQTKCAWCGSGDNDPGDNFCSACNKPLKCVYCGTRVTKQRTTCGVCGKNLLPDALTVSR
ncbi:MAG TPA: CHAT domain-containing protein [Ktedonobacteraceae bacterium]|nr:CHAT domain-containing protein [Ktedonobacteraceae bacterium]